MNYSGIAQKNITCCKLKIYHSCFGRTDPSIFTSTAVLLQQTSRAPNFVKILSHFLHLKRKFWIFSLCMNWICYFEKRLLSLFGIWFKIKKTFSMLLLIPKIVHNPSIVSHFQQIAPAETFASCTPNVWKFFAINV